MAPTFDSHPHENTGCSPADVTAAGATADPMGAWYRVSQELRACKESQQRAWGDVDSATLGRYLAGEADAHELATVETALEELPELRKLTDLVRDVLGSLPPIELDAPPLPLPVPASASAEEAAAPAVLLPFRPAATLRPAARPQRRRRGVVSFLRRRGSLVAAACLLVVLGAAMPSVTPLAGPRRTERAVSAGGELAFLSRGRELPDARILLTGVAADLDAEPQAPPIAPLTPTPVALTTANPEMTSADAGPAGMSQPMVRGMALPERAPAVRRGPARAGRDPAAATMPQHARSETARGVYYYRYQGDLTQAARHLSNAAVACQTTLGPKAPATAWTVRQLADCYQSALNNTTATTTNATAEAVNGPRVMMMARGGMVQGAESNLEVSARSLRHRLTNLPCREVRAAVVPVLGFALRVAPDLNERQRLLRALAQLGPAAEGALPMLQERLLHSQDPAEVADVLLVLDQLGPAARQAVPQLARLAAKGGAYGNTNYANSKVQPSPTDRTTDSKGQSAPDAGDLFARLKGREGRVGVQDRAGCFSVKALRDSVQEMRELLRRGDVEVLVETASNAAEAKLALQRRRKLPLRAAHVLIDLQGPTVEVRLGDDLARVEGLAERVRDAVKSGCQKRHYDRALKQGLALLSDGLVK